MFSGVGVTNADGSEWYFPQRLTDDTAAVADGNVNPAQSVLDVQSTMGHDLPHSLLMMPSPLTWADPASSAPRRSWRNSPAFR